MWEIVFVLPWPTKRSSVIHNGWLMEVSVFLTPAEWTIHLGAPVVPEEYMMNRGCLNGSCSNSSWGNWSNSPYPDAKKSSINTLQRLLKKKKKKKKSLKWYNQRECKCMALTRSLTYENVGFSLSVLTLHCGCIRRHAPVGDLGEVCLMLGASIGNYHDFLQVRETWRERETTDLFYSSHYSLI